MKGIFYLGKGEHTQILLVSGGKDGRQWVVPGN